MAAASAVAQARTWSGVRLPFFVGCHWAAISACREANELVTETFWPAQHGQPWPLVRLLSEASHSWSGPSGHIHQTFLRTTTCSGVKPPFLVGCHWAANSGRDWLSVVFVLVCAMSTNDNLGLGLRIYTTRYCATLGVV